MATIMLLIGLIVAAAVVTGGFYVKQNAVRAASLVVAIIVLFVFVALSSIRYVGENQLGVIVKNFGSDMAPGQIVAVNGEKGPQAEILGPGWHFWYWPGLYDVEIQEIIEIKTDDVGLIATTDGMPLPADEAFAAEWDKAELGRMLDAVYFLSQGQGIKGPQASTLRPGKYRINPRLYSIETIPVTNIKKATVGVVKSNVGKAPTDVEVGEDELVDVGQRGIWRVPYSPQKLYLNTKAYEITMISTTQQIIRYGMGDGADDKEIEVRTSDGFTFPVDVRVEYQIKEEDAPLVVSELGDDQELLRQRLASTVRAIFRNNAEAVKALDYVKERSHQESSTATALAEEMSKIGVTVTSVRIGSIAADGSLAEILKTQTDREIAVQEQLTFQEQQRAAEQKKELTRTEQEAEEERRLATARYSVQIADEEKQKIIIGAEAQAESIRVRAEAQAEAYRVIAEQIGMGNAALIELLNIVGEQGINITPRVMVIGGNGEAGGAKNAETTALIGTMLDTMIHEQEDEEAAGD